MRWAQFSKNNRKQHQVHILQGLPGIGPSRAADLLDYFGSVGKVFNASSGEMCKVPGIGNTTAKRIRKILE